MKIAVIMGAYNVEKTVARSIDSILKQSYEEWIFIICDDGSTDGTIHILNSYKEKYPEKFIILSNEKNRGLTYSLNHCLQYADTEFVARMDADDISLPGRFEAEVDFLSSNEEYAFVGCAVERFDEDGVWKKCGVIEKPDSKVFYNTTGFTHPTILIRRKALEAVNNYNDVWYTNRCEDYDLWMRLYAAGYKGYNLKEILFQYYEGKDSFPKRKYRYRFGEAVMRAKGYAALGLYPKGLIFVLKPLVAGLLPSTIVKKIHKKRL